MRIKAIRKSRFAFWLGLVILLAAAGSAAGLAASSGTHPLPPAKQHLLDQAAAARQRARKVPKANLSPPAHGNLPARVPGIVNSGIDAGPFPPSVFSVRNVWNGPFAGAWYLVYAGAQLNGDGNAIAAGGVRIYSLPVDPNAEDQTLALVGSFTAPTPDALRVVSAAGDELTLSTDSGTTYSFNLSTKQFH